MSNLQAKFEAAETYMNQVVFERDEETHLIMGLLVARQHGFFLGQPGVAKSFMIKTFMDCFDGVFFQKLLTQFTTPKEIFGPISLSALKRDEQKYNLDGFLADVPIAYLNEIFKGNSEVLNSLLTIMEERQFQNGNEVIGAPLVSIFADSNELPADSTLEAMYDRFTVRMVVNEILHKSNFEAMLSGNFVEPPKDKLTVADLAEAHAQSRKVSITPVVDALWDLRQRIRVNLAGTLRVSDRRWNKCAKFLQAMAWLGGATEVTPDDMIFLENCLWESPDQRASVAKEIQEGGNVSVVVSRTQELYNEAVALVEYATGPNVSPAELGDIYAQLGERRDEVEAKIEKNPAQAPHLKPILKRLESGVQAVREKYLAAQGL